MAPTWFSIIALAGVTAFVFYMILDIYIKYDAEMHSHNKEWE